MSTDDLSEDQTPSEIPGGESGGTYSREWRIMVRAIKEHDEWFQRLKRHALAVEQVRETAKNLAALNAARIEEVRLKAWQDNDGLRRELAEAVRAMEDFKADQADRIELSLKEVPKALEDARNEFRQEIMVITGQDVDATPARDRLQALEDNLTFFTSQLTKIDNLDDDSLVSRVTRLERRVAEMGSGGGKSET